MVTVGAHAAMLSAGVHRLAAQRAAGSSSRDDFGNIAPQDAQLFPCRATSKRGWLSWFLFFRAAAFDVVDQQHVAWACLELTLVLAQREAADFEVDGRVRRERVGRRLARRSCTLWPLKLGQELLDGQSECLKLLLFDPQCRRAAIITFDEQAKCAVARLTNRLGLQARGRPEGILGVKHSTVRI
jgi:hypothetical protein